MRVDSDTTANNACPRCGAAFHCGANDPAPCACRTLRLDAATLQSLREQYASCLCLNCLLQLQPAPGEG